ncbi:MAG: GNAT family N-acetyltransferase [Verrucomicrobia bacterium]|nr:GNAT family N-acetyltransferase [Verrucomicrobiota bacterium]
MLLPDDNPSTPKPIGPPRSNGEAGVPSRPWVINARETTMSSSAEAAQIVDPRADSSWDASLETLPGATVFHSTAWFRVLTASYGHRPFFLRLRTPEGELAVLPLAEVRSWLTGLRGISLPFTDLCPPLGASNLFPSLLEKALALAREHRWKYLELRDLQGNPFSSPPSICYTGHQADLQPSKEQLLANLKSAVRTALRKAEKSGVDVRVGDRKEDVQNYFELHCRTRRKHGVPPQPWRFFHHLHEELFRQGKGFVVTAWRGEQAIAASIFVHSYGHAVYKFGASDERYLECRAPTLVMWNGMLECKRLGCTVLHMGRTSPSNEGLSRFKAGFGAIETPVSYFRLNPKDASVDKMTDMAVGPLNRLIGLAPSWLARKAGEVLYPHMS